MIGNKRIVGVCISAVHKGFKSDFIERLNPKIVVERFTSEAPPRLVVAPNWGLKRNDVVMRAFERRLEERDTWQGRLYV